MLETQLAGLKRILCVGAHSDDIEIGCGGTVLKILAANPNVEIMWVVFSAEGVRAREATSSAKAFLGKSSNHVIVAKDFRTSYFPYQGEQIKEYFETLKSFNPDVIFTHYRDDRHQDHRVLSDLAWNTFRSHVILEYEVPKYDGDYGSPNFFVPVTEKHVKKKADLLCKFFQSQSNKHWFTPDLFMATPRIRGMECNSPTQFAEAFYSRKLVFSI
jgi:LmbE family N-acetylglucosaminyl deacetylase